MLQRTRTASLRTKTPESGQVAAKSPARPVVGTKSGLPTVLVYFLCDLVCISSVYAIALGVATNVRSDFDTNIRLLTTILGVNMFWSWHSGLYSAMQIRPAVEMRKLMLSGLGVAFILAIISILVPEKRTTLLFLAAAAMMAAPLQWLVRCVTRHVFGKSAWWGRRALLVNCGPASQRLYERLMRNASSGLRPVGFVLSFEDSESLSDHHGYLGPDSELAEIMSSHDVSLGITSYENSSRVGPTFDLLSRPDRAIPDWLILTPDSHLPSLWTTTSDVMGMPALATTNRLRCFGRSRLKRMFDLTIIAMFSPVLVPVMAVLYLLVRFTSPGPVFYSQQRLGRGGKKFRAWKFRSMVVNADAVLKDYLAQNPAMREEWEATQKLKNDPRVTWIGKIIRKTSLDELPQIWNVLVGEMSLVGPRPIVESEIPKYGDFYVHYSSVPPGITGLWQINGRNNTTYEERVAYDSYYVRNWSMWFDLHILACTAKVVLLREGAY